MSDMQTMPVRDLIASMRDQIQNAPNENAVQLLVLGVLVRRIEEQADLADKWEGVAGAIKELITSSDYIHEPSDKLVERINTFLDNAYAGETDGKI